MQNHLEISSKIQFWTRNVRNWTKIYDFGHVRTYCWLNELRNTQGKTHGTYLGNIYGIYKECIRNIHRYLWYKIIWNTGAAFGGAPMGRPPSAAAPLGLCFWSFYIKDIYGYSMYTPYIFHIYFLNMFRIFSLVCFLIYSVNRRFGHDRSPALGLISHISGPKLSFWGNF